MGQSPGFSTFPLVFPAHPISQPANKNPQNRRVSAQGGVFGIMLKSCEQLLTRSPREKRCIGAWRRIGL